MDSYEAMQWLRRCAVRHFKDRAVVYFVTKHVDQDTTLFVTAQGAMWHAHRLLGDLGFEERWRFEERWKPSQHSLCVFIWDPREGCPGVTVEVMQVLP